MADKTDHQIEKPPQQSQKSDIASSMPNPQNIITAPKQDLRSEFKGEEPKMPQPSNINTPPIYILSNEIKKNLNPQSQEK